MGEYTITDIEPMNKHHYISSKIASIIRPSTIYWGLIVTIAIIVVICGLAAIAYQDMAS